MNTLERRMFKYDWGMENIETLCENLNQTDIVEVEIPVGYVPPKSVVKFGETKLFKDSQYKTKTLVIVNFDNEFPNQSLAINSSQIVVWEIEFRVFCEWARSVESLTQALVDL